MFPRILLHYHPLTSVPGGKKILTRVAGKDASKQFWKYHNEGILKKYKSKLQVGSLDSKKQTAQPPQAPKKEQKKDAVVPSAESGLVAPMPGPAAKSQEEEAEALDPFGDQVPYADPSWYQSVSSPFLSRFLLSYKATDSSSIILHTSTNLMQLSAKKSASGSPVKSNPTSANGMKPDVYRRRYTSRWGLVVTWLV